jgi:hypothetical protein
LLQVLGIAVGLLLGLGIRLLGFLPLPLLSNAWPVLLHQQLPAPRCKVPCIPFDAHRQQTLSLATLYGKHLVWAGSMHSTPENQNSATLMCDECFLGPLVIPFAGKFAPCKRR